MGYELSDRWDEAQTLMRLVRELWNRIEKEDATAGGLGQKSSQALDDPFSASALPMSEAPAARIVVLPTT